MMYFVKWKRTSLRTIVTLMATLLFVSSGLFISGSANAFNQDELGPNVFGPTAIGEAQPYNLLSPGFDDALRSTRWIPAGVQPGYIFNFDNTAGRNGSGAAFINEPTNDLINTFSSYTQTLTVDGNLQVGKSIAFSGWVKAENVACKPIVVGTQNTCQGIGAYMAIEYYNGSGTRISFDQTGPIIGNKDWTYRRAVGVIPQGTVSVKLNFILNGMGKAYFDDAALAYYSDSSVINAVYAQQVELNVTNSLLNTDIRGLGVNLNPHFARPGRLSTQDEQLITERLQLIKPAWVRVFTDTRWWVTATGNDFTTLPLMNGLVKDLQIIKGLGAKVNLVMTWPNYLQPKEVIADHMADLIEWLLQNKQLHIDGLTLYNEPDNSNSFPGTVADYVALYQEMADVLAARGLHDVKLIGGDVSASDTFTEAIAGPLQSDLGMLSFHSYVHYKKPMASTVLRTAMVAKFAQSKGLDEFLWETNVGYGAGFAAFTPGKVDDVLMPKRYPSMLKLAAYAMQTLAVGVKGLSYWEAFDMNYGELGETGWIMSYGMWGTKEQGYPLRPAYYSYQLLSSQIQPGSSIRKVTSTSADSTLLSYMIDKPDGSQALFLLNPWDKPVSVTAHLGDASYTNQKAKRIIYNSTEVASAIAEGRITLSKTEVSLSGGSYIDVIQPESMMIIELDKVPPVTTATLSPAQPEGQNGWYVNPVTVSLTATNNLSVSSGSEVAATYYTIDGGAQQSGNSVTLTTDGVHTLAYWSVDNAGNIEQQHTTTVKIDKTAPLLTVQLDITSIWPPNHNMVTVHATLNSSDAASGVASVVLTSITSNEPDSGQGDIEAAIGTSATTFSLRAERLGNGTGRIYTITYTITDNVGNKSTAVSTVSVPHNQ